MAATTQRFPELVGVSTPAFVDVTGILPPARASECHALAANGERASFANLTELLRWAGRRAVTAVCLDGCAWRSFATFQHFLSQGLAADEAFDMAELSGWPTTVSYVAELRRRSGQVRRRVA